VDASSIPLLFVRGAQKARRLPSIDLIEAFLAVIEQRNVGRAGRVLGLSQPAMSARIARFEAELGTPLFSRQGRTIAPTGEAKALAPRLRAALSELAAALGVDPKEDADVMLRLGTLPTFSSHLLTPLLAAPAGQKLTLHHALTNALVEDLRRGALDVIVGAGRAPRDARLAIEQLGTIVPAAIAATTAPSLPRVVSAADLKSRRLAMVPRADEPFFDGVRQWIDDERLAPRVALSIPHLQSLIAVAIASDLITIVPSYMVAGDDRVRVGRVHGLNLRIPVWSARNQADRREEVLALVGRLRKARPILARAARVGLARERRR
jgi:DNA-binding transcriptional LysR family regulator